MALSKTNKYKEIDLTYQRIEHISVYPDLEGGLMEVRLAQFKDKASRDLSLGNGLNKVEVNFTKNNHATLDLTGNLFSQAYTLLKTLPAWSDAVDVIESK